jgi:hypothetical protein
MRRHRRAQYPALGIETASVGGLFRNLMAGVFAATATLSPFSGTTPRLEGRQMLNMAKHTRAKHRKVAPPGDAIRQHHKQPALIKESEWLQFQPHNYGRKVVLGIAVAWGVFDLPLSFSSTRS